MWHLPGEARNNTFTKDPTGMELQRSVKIAPCLRNCALTLLLSALPPTHLVRSLDRGVGMVYHGRKTGFPDQKKERLRRHDYNGMKGESES